jgi:hypothetical protein
MVGVLQRLNEKLFACVLSVYFSERHVQLSERCFDLSHSHITDYLAIVTNFSFDRIGIVACISVGLFSHCIT